MKKAIVSVILCSSIFICGFGQCDQSLESLVKSKTGESERLINSFNVKLEEASIDQPAPVAKFNQYMESGKMYRLAVYSNDTLQNTFGILRLFDGNRLIGITYAEKTGKNWESFHFKCQGSGNYKLLVTMKDGKEGCAIVGVYSTQ